MTLHMLAVLLSLDYFMLIISCAESPRPQPQFQSLSGKAQSAQPVVIVTAITNYSEEYKAKSVKEREKRQQMQDSKGPLMGYHREPV